MRQKRRSGHLSTIWWDCDVKHLPGQHNEYSAFIRRVLRAYSRRVGDGDVEALALMLDLAEDIDTAVAEAVKSLRACGYSWAEIGSQLGITHQAAQQRWGTS